MKDMPLRLVLALLAAVWCFAFFQERYQKDRAITAANDAATVAKEWQELFRQEMRISPDWAFITIPIKDAYDGTDVFTTKVPYEGPKPARFAGE